MDISLLLNKGEPSSKAKYNILSDSEKYREGMYEIVVL